jgi:hypothetical protein
MPPEAAADLVARAEDRLWSPGESVGRNYLTGPRRCLTPETARAAHLGLTAPEDKIAYESVGIVIPWYNAGRLALVKVRVLDGWLQRYPKHKRPPKYFEVFRDPALATVYPGPEAVRPGRPLVIVEGEFDALLLGHALADLAAVVTLGSASAHPGPRILGPLLAAHPWYVATDHDPAGDGAAARWPVSTRRVPPPAPYKDWTEARRDGVHLRRWWEEVLADNGQPVLFTPEELAAMRWGPKVDDPTPGIVVVDRPDRGRLIETLRAAAADPEERAAIQAEAADDESHPGPDPGDELQDFLRRLNERGVRLDGELVYPEIKVATITGRVTYKKPPLQTLPEPDRLRRIGPVVPGRGFLRFDFGQIEPRILLAILRRRGLIAWEAGEDLYRDLIPDATVEREDVKTVVNAAINGQRSKLQAGGRLAEFARATEAYRNALAAEAKGRWYVETLAGRKIRLAAGESNFPGKAVNRVVQGTAADIFNRAAVNVDRAIRERGLPAAVAPPYLR